MQRLLIFVCLFVALHSTIYSQESAWEGNVAFNYSLKGWKLNTSLGHRSIQEKTDESKQTRLAFLEINQFITRKISPQLSLSIGYKYRDNKVGDAEQRFTQQVAYKHLMKHVRLVSRLRLEQRFSSEFVHRYRYRFSMDMPLSGLRLDVKECYLVASNELLLVIEDSANSFDNRLSFGLGYVFSNSTKFQVDATHRMENLNKDVAHIPFLTTSLIFNVK